MDRLRAAESRNVTHRSTAVFWDRAKGSNVIDADGNRFIDMTGAFGVAAVGHAHPRVIAAIEDQARTLLHGMGDIHPSEAKVTLLEQLAEIAPWKETRAVLSSSGSEAVEAALKTAHLATGRPGILAFEGAYHGLTLGALGSTHRKHFRKPFVDRLKDQVQFVPFPTTPEQVAPVLDEVEAALVDPLRRVGAVLIEPVQGRAGCRIPAEGFLAALQERVRTGGALLIADEIYSGLGRCGAWFASTSDACTPDLICVGKALGGGMPISALLGRRSAMDAWPESGGEAIHTSTFLGHPASCAAASAVLNIIESEGLLDRASETGSRLVGRLRTAFDGSPRVASVRGRGMLLGVELSSVGFEICGGGAGVCHSLLGKGIIALPAGPLGEVVQLAPALNLPRALEDYVVEALVETVIR